MIGKDELAEAARYNDARSEEFGTVDRVLKDLGIDTGEAFYVAEQRAMRCYAIFTNQLPAFQRTGRIEITDRHIFNSLLIAEIDGMTIGGKALQRNEVTYNELMDAAREILRETIRDPQEGHPEYTRGVVNLIAEVSGKFKVETSTRMDEIARELGVTL